MEKTEIDWFSQPELFTNDILKEVQDAYKNSNLLPEDNDIDNTCTDLINLVGRLRGAINEYDFYSIQETLGNIINEALAGICLARIVMVAKNEAEPPEPTVEDEEDNDLKYDIYSVYKFCGSEYRYCVGKDYVGVALARSQAEFYISYGFWVKEKDIYRFIKPDHILEIIVEKSE